MGQDLLAGFLGTWSAELNLGSVLLRVLLSMLLSAIVGCERSSKRHSAGLRTFMLVSLVGTGTMLVDQYILHRLGGSLPLLSAAACDMHVHVNVSRNNGLSLQIIGFHSRKSLISLNSILHQKDFFPLNKDIFLSQFLRCVHIRVFQ